jgi:hypothetical protein
MASGRLATPILVGNVLGVNTLVYTVPIGTYTVCTLSLTNTTTSAVTVRVALTTSAASPGAAEYIEYDTVIAGKGVFERTGMVLQAGMNIVGVSDTNAALAATVYGIETSIT